MNCLGSKPISCVCKRYVECRCRSLNEGCLLVYSNILILIFLVLRTNRNRKMRPFWTNFFILCCHLSFSSRVTGNRKIDFNYCTTTRIFPTSCWIDLVRVTRGTLSFCTWILLCRFYLLQFNLRFVIIILSCLDRCETGCTFLFDFFQKSFLLLPHMVFDLFSWITFRKNYYSRFYTLINIALSIGWRHYNNTR